MALELSGGEQRTGVSAVLVGGAGSVQGAARTAGGQLLGGVSVVVQGRGLQLETATLTSGVGDNGVGSYALSGLLQLKCTSRSLPPSGRSSIWLKSQS